MRTSRPNRSARVSWSDFRSDVPPVSSEADDARLVVHASCVGWRGRAALILGASGSGKSTLALQLIALGAELVSDDRTALSRTADGLIAAPPDSIAGLIEARHVGLMRLPFAPHLPVSLAVNLDLIESERLPPQRSIAFLGVPLTLLHRVDGPQFPPALLHCLSGARLTE